MSIEDMIDEAPELATSLEVRNYANGLEVEFFTAELPFYIFGNQVNIVFTVGLPGGEYCIVGKQSDYIKTEQLDAAIRWYHVDKKPEYRDFFFDKDCKVRGSWTFVDAEEELGEILEWYQERYPNGYFQPKQILWADQENRLPGEDGYSQGFDVQPVLKAPIESNSEIIIKKLINKNIRDESFSVIGFYGEWKSPADNPSIKNPTLYQTFGLIEFGIPELVYFSSYPTKVAEKFLRSIAEQLIQNENPEYEAESVDAMAGVILKEVDVVSGSEQRLELWKKFFELELIRISQVFEADDNDKFPEDDGYDWNKKPQPFFEDQ